ncbi:MAG: outer membrane lipoprotein-sorting protein [Nitrospira sp.]|nr:MAG: outer membrane lipoprotein-sorting protein [Nitrospira sp.]
MTTYSKLRPSGTELSLVVKFNLPVDVQGTTFLQIQNADTDDDMWIYLPALKKTRRLVSANKRDSFVGSDFAYGDVLTLSPKLFQHVLVKSEVYDNVECFVVESVPKDQSKVEDFGYTKKVTWLRKDNYLESRVEYFNDRNERIKTQTTSNHRLLQAQPPRWIAMKREMVNHESGHKTIVLVEKTDTEKELEDNLFTVRSIETK